MFRLFFMVLIVAAAGYGWHLTHPAEPDGPQFRAAPVTRGDVLVLVSATGTINPVISVTVGSQISGLVSKLNVDFNSQVTTGQVLAEIDPATFQTAVFQAQANLDKSQSAKLTAEAALLRTKANVETANANVTAAIANVDKSKAEVVSQEKNLARQQPLIKEKLVAPTDIDKAVAARDEAVAAEKASEAQVGVSRAQLEAAKADVGSAELAVKSSLLDIKQRQADLDIANINLSRCKILAPVNGVVVSRAVDVGQTVAASFSAPTLFVIAQDLTQMQINTSIDEADVGKIHEGQDVKFTVDAYTDRSFNGKIKQVRLGPIVNSNVVTYDTVVSVANPDLKLLPGMTASASILVSRADEVLRVPAAALGFKYEEDEESPAARAGDKPDRPGGGGGGQGRVGGPGKARGKDRSRLFAKKKADKAPHVYVLTDANEVKEVEVKTGLSDGRFVEVMDPKDEVVTGHTGAGLEGMPKHEPSPDASASPDADGQRHHRHHGDGQGGHGGWRKRNPAEAAGGASPAPDASDKADKGDKAEKSDEPEKAPFSILKEGVQVIIGREAPQKDKSALGGGNPFSQQRSGGGNNNPMRGMR